MTTNYDFTAAARKRRQRERAKEEYGAVTYTLQLTPAELRRLRQHYIADHGHDWTLAARRAGAAALKPKAPSRSDGQLTLLPD